MTEFQSFVEEPRQFIVLYDHQDGGVILLDTIPDSQTRQNKVYDSDWESVPDQIANETVYDSYLNYVREVLKNQRELLDEVDVDYDPTSYRPF